jgi:hypothetical protein
MGHSVGRWDGDTLVVESSGYNDQTWLDNTGHPHSENLRAACCGGDPENLRWFLDVKRTPKR